MQTSVRIMNKLIHISQPRVYPHISYLDKINRADLFIYSDDLKPKKNLFETRNRYYCEQSKSSKYLNVPIKRGDIFRETQITQEFVKNHISILHHNYKDYPHYDYDLLKYTMPNIKLDSFLDFANLHLNLLFNVFDINTPTHYTSVVKSSKTGQERLDDIIKYYGGTEYLSGIEGKEYISTLSVPYKLHDTKSPRFDYGREFMPMIYDTIFLKGMDWCYQVLHNRPFKKHH